MQVVNLDFILAWIHKTCLTLSIICTVVLFNHLDVPPCSCLCSWLQATGGQVDLWITVNFTFYIFEYLWNFFLLILDDIV